LRPAGDCISAVAECSIIAAWTLTGGVDPARHYIDATLPDVLEGRIQPGRVFDQSFPLEQTPDAYRAMSDRRTLKALITL
jgi:threonine dehydrogenase-like Zn-dependent dehydrogenase